MSKDSIEQLINAEVDRRLSEIQDSSYQRPESKFPPWEIGLPYHIETVTKYFTGILVDITETDFVLSNVCWIESTGNFSDYAKGGKPDYAEPYDDNQIVMISRGAYVSAVKREIIIELIGR